MRSAEIRSQIFMFIREWRNLQIHSQMVTKITNKFEFLTKLRYPIGKLTFQLRNLRTNI